MLRFGYVYIDILDLIFFVILPSSILLSWYAAPTTVTSVFHAIMLAFDSPLVQAAEQSFHSALASVGVPPPYPAASSLAMVATGSVITMAAYFVSVGRRHWEHRKDIETELLDAMQKVSILEDRLQAAKQHEIKKELGKENVRIFMDGAFDLMHYGHMNAFRLGRSLGTHLVVAINSSETIAECKGFAPIMNDKERCTAVKNCRFVDETIERSPYVMTQEYLDWVIKEYNIDYVVHGDDPCLVNGVDVYGPVKQMGKYKSIPRTEGISTTDLIGRILTVAPAKKGTSPRSEAGRERSLSDPEGNKAPRTVSRSKSISDLTPTPTNASSRFMTTSSILRKFSQGMKSPPPGASIVYIDGTWDMFHAGHIEILKEARALGTYLIAGVFSDGNVADQLGYGYPIMTQNERMLSVIGCKLVDDVLIDAPLCADEDMIASLNISLVVTADIEPLWEGFTDRQIAARRRGILKRIEGSSDNISLSDIITRLNKNRNRYEKKFETKKKAEDEYYDERYKRDLQKDQ